MYDPSVGQQVCATGVGPRSHSTGDDGASYVQAAHFTQHRGVSAAESQFLNASCCWNA